MHLEFQEYKWTVELLEPLLGTIPKNPDVYEAYVQSQLHQDDEQVDAVPDPEKGWTGFYVNDEGRPVMFDYQWKGFLKEAGNIIKDSLKNKEGKLERVPALRNSIDNTVFVFPRMLVLADKPDDILERPLRAMTPQGPRVALVRSDIIKPPKTWELEIRILPASKCTKRVLEAILEYGELKGIGQWRNGGYGRIKSKIEKL